MNLKKSKTAKLFAGVLGLGMALSFALPAGAQTIADLQAQIAQLQQLIAQLQGGSASTGASMMFTSNLTVGSSGSQVTALQQWLVSKGYLSMPAGVSYGYFGNLTKMALAKYQADAGISPAAGYFGPITRAKLNAMASTGGTTGGTTTGGTTTGITTPGAEGTLTVTGSNAGVNTTVYAGDVKDKVLGFKVQALGSDIAIQRVKVDLGSNTTEYNKIFQTLYVMDANGNVLASLPMNSSNVVKDSGEYYATISGFSSVVPKGANNQYYIGADLYNTIDSQYTDGDTFIVQLANDGVRGTDGAGIDQYSPSTGSTVNSTVSTGANLADSASLTVSSDAATPATSAVTANQGSNNNQYDQLPLLTFDVQAKKDNVEITDAVLRVSKTGSGAALASSTMYLYDGSTAIGTASISSAGYATFSNLNYTVPKDTTKALTVKVDIRSADATSASFTATASSTGFTAQSSNGTSVTSANKTGSVTGNSVTVRSVGPVITLTSKSITTSGSPQGGGSNNLSTSTLTATFNFHITAVGGAIIFGTAASATPAFASSTTGFQVYINSASNNAQSSLATSTSWSFPSVCTSTGTNSCTLSENNSMDVAVTYQIYGRNSAGIALSSGLYSIGVAGIQWVGAGTAQTSTFMAGLSDWRTADVSFP